jgi:hypothetical protein
MQNANASYQLTQLIGKVSLAPGVSVHDWLAESHLRSATRAACEAGSKAVHAVFQPVPGMLRLAPAPAGGALAVALSMYALTNFRKRATVTSNSSSW